ncbi:MAG TPA: YkgJ family cysteine cluster protein [Frankiaceae bacterium]|nr:YkgJ family cysteine cluster protein [Frankiaceae bacterium]
MDAESGDRDAGEFGSWLSEFRASLHDGDPAGVPCDGCTACCRSGKLIPVEPDELEALAHIATEDLVPEQGQPGQPARRVLRHDESGRCSQLTAEGCSVYAHRPRACRMYDCRIFPAAGVLPDSPLIADRAQQWRFSYASAASRERHGDVRMAAVALGFPGGLSSPSSPTQRALDAIEGAAEIGG